MNYLLFGLEILFIVMGIALVPARSELRICRSRVTYNRRPELEILRSFDAENCQRAERHGFVK
jgi:hypothetical protein